MAPRVAALCTLFISLVISANFSRIYSCVNSHVNSASSREVDCRVVLPFCLHTKLHFGSTKRHAHLHLSAPVLYYANGTQTFRLNLQRMYYHSNQLLLSGDIESNPGPVFHHDQVTTTHPSPLNVSEFKSTEQPYLNLPSALGLVGHIDMRRLIACRPMPRPITSSLNVNADTFMPAAAAATTDRPIGSSADSFCDGCCRGDSRFPLQPNFSRSRSTNNHTISHNIRPISF